MQQARGVVMRGAAQDRRRLPRLDDAAAVHDDDAVGDAADDAEVVGDEQDAHPQVALQPLDQLEDLCLDGDVQCGGRLVGDQHRRVGRQRHRDHGALAHPAAELVGIVVKALVRVGDADLHEALDRAPPRGLAAHRRMEADRLDDLLADALDRVQARERVLEDHPGGRTAQPAQLLFVEAGQVGPASDPAAIVMRAVEAAGRGWRARSRSCRAGLADEGDDLARL